MSILELQNVEKIYGEKENQVRALRNINLQVEEGEFVAIVGTSGSGKSTLLNLIGALDNPTRGKIFIKKREIGSLSRKELTIFRRREQMEENFGITNYSFIHASPAEGAETASVSNQLLQTIRDVPKAVLQDYTSAIKTQRNYLNQQQIFFSSIAVILFIISLFHIMNSMNHTILARRKEYGIMRAMGITDSGFYKMILQTGILYGLLADALIFVCYHYIFRRVMDYYMAHVVQFLHVTSTVPNMVLAGIMVLNVVLAIVAVMIPARKMIRETIISEIRQ